MKAKVNHHHLTAALASTLLATVGPALGQASDTAKEASPIPAEIAQALERIKAKDGPIYLGTITINGPDGTVQELDFGDRSLNELGLEDWLLSKAKPAPQAAPTDDAAAAKMRAKITVIGPDGTVQELNTGESPLNELNLVDMLKGLSKAKPAPQAAPTDDAAAAKIQAKITLIGPDGTVQELNSGDPSLNELGLGDSPKIRYRSLGTWTPENKGLSLGDWLKGQSNAKPAPQAAPTDDAAGAKMRAKITIIGPDGTVKEFNSGESSLNELNLGDLLKDLPKAKPAPQAAPTDDAARKARIEALLEELRKELLAK